MVVAFSDNISLRNADMAMYFVVGLERSKHNGEIVAMAAPVSRFRCF